MRKFFVIIILLLCLSAAWVSGKLLSKEASNSATKEASLEDAKITLSTKVSFTYHYALCSHTITEDLSQNKEFIGRDLQSLKEFLPDAQITSFSQECVSIKKEIGTYCPNHLILKSFNGKVFLMRCEAKTGSLQPKKQLAFCSSLTTEAMKALETGMVVISESQAREYLSYHKKS